MFSYPMIHHVHSASAVVTILLAVATPMLGWQWQRRASPRLRTVPALDRTATIAMLATMLTGVALARWGGWWPLGWVRISLFMLALAFVLDLAAAFPRIGFPRRLRWSCRVVALLAVLALMVIKPA